MNIVVIGLSHHVSPVKLRERFAFAETNIPDALNALRKSGIAGEAVILSTCNRVEIYAATSIEPVRAFAELKQFLLRSGDETTSEEHLAPQQSPTMDAAPSAGNSITTVVSPLESRGEIQLPQDDCYALAEPESLYHLFKVACGLDSMVLGETEILGQLKQAYSLAQKNGHTGARLNKAFQRAFNVAKHVRTHTNIQRGSISVASAAVELAEKIFGSLNDHDVLVIGAGEMSEKTARALLSRGARSIVIAGRSLERAQILAAELGGLAVQFDAWETEFEHVDIAISSTSAPHPILDRARLESLMKARRHRPLLLIDIAVPRDIDPAVDLLENVYLYNIDDLRAIADNYLKQRKDEIARCEAIIAGKVKPLLELKNKFQPRMNTDGHGLETAPAKP